MVLVRKPTITKPGPWPLWGHRVPRDWLWAWGGLELAFTFWEGGGTPHEVRRGLVPTVSGVPTWTMYQQGTSLKFDSTDLVDITDIGFTVGHTGDVKEFTILLAHWFNGDMTTRQRLFKLHNAGGSRFYGERDGSYANDPYFIGMYSVGSAWVWNQLNNYPAAPSYEVWVITFVDTQSPDFYINGDLQTWDITGAWGAGMSNANGLRLGANGSGSLVSNCSLMSFCLWSRVLNSVEIAQVSRDPFGPFRQERRAAFSVPAAVAAEYPMFRRPNPLLRM